MIVTRGSLQKKLIESIFPWKIGQRIIINDARVTSTHVSGSRLSVEDEAGLEFHRGGALTFRGLESTGIIDRPLRLPFDERPCYSIASGTVTTNCVRPRRPVERGHVDFVNWIPRVRQTDWWGAPPFGFSEFSPFFPDFLPRFLESQSNEFFFGTFLGCGIF